jgi:hypothetical protein
MITSNSSAIYNFKEIIIIHYNNVKYNEENNIEFVKKKEELTL